MRPYIVRHLIAVGTAAVVVTFSGSCQGYNAISVEWEGAADEQYTPDTATATAGPLTGATQPQTQQAAAVVLTVEQCIDANASGGSLEEALIKKDIIEEPLLQTKVTKAMCEDLREQTPDDTLVQRLFAAHNYVQEIKLIKEAMRMAGGESAAKRPDPRFIAYEPLVRKRNLLAAVEGTTGEQASVEWEGAADEQYTPGTATATAGPLTGATQPQTQQAAAAASVGEDGDASTAQMYDQKEAAVRKEGASQDQAAAAARCGVEFWVLDKEVGEKVTELYEIDPLIPKEMTQRQTKQAGLVVSLVTRKKFQEIRDEYGGVAEVSESNIGCVKLSDRMKASLVPIDELDFDAYPSDEIRELSSDHNTRWDWDITASQTGEQALKLVLAYDATSPGPAQFRTLKEPVYDGAIEVTEGNNDDNNDERPWWQRIF